MEIKFSRKGDTGSNPVGPVKEREYMIAFVGDIHGNINALVKIIDHLKAQWPSISAIIQVGDFGLYPEKIAHLQRINPFVPIYAIDGNHEYFPLVTQWVKETEIAPNIFYMPRGTVKDIDGRKIGFLGGAASVDKQLRIQYKMGWYPEEVVTQKDISKFDGVDKLDILVTHCPPYQTIIRNFDQRNLLQYGLRPEWVDPSSVLVESLWMRLGRPKLVCGHMHRNVSDNNVLILDINQIWCM